MKIIIIGVGPRGLSTALYSLYKGHQVILIDNKPLHTWTSQYLITDMEMRSPISFDLVTYLEELQDFSLAKYLGYPHLITTKQSDIEGNNIRVTRPQFCDYIKWVYSYIKSKVTIINQKVTNVEENKVILTDGSFIEGDAVIFCTGYKGKDNIPLWLTKTTNLSKLVNLSTILSQPNSYRNQKGLVIGSGQGAAEIVNYLSKLNNQVCWAIKKTPKVSQYPAPTYREWGMKSALGGYYRNLKDWNQRLTYLKKVKEWQPSITPYIESKLQSTDYLILKLNDYSEVTDLEVDFVVQAAGITPSISSLPIKLDVPVNPYLSNFPNINNHFKINLPNCNWYVSGILATAFDGPRQHSLISAGVTAKEIVEDIERGNI